MTILTKLETAKANQTLVDSKLDEANALIEQAQNEADYSMSMEHIDRAMTLLLEANALNKKNRKFVVRQLRKIDRMLTIVALINRVKKN